MKDILIGATIGALAIAYLGTTGKPSKIEIVQAAPAAPVKVWEAPPAPRPEVMQKTADTAAPVKTVIKIVRVKADPPKPRPAIVRQVYFSPVHVCSCML